MFFVQKEDLTVEQRQMYAAEKLINFRFLAKLLGTRSNYILTSSDLVPITLQSELSVFSQFAEVAYSVVPVELIFQKFEILSETGFPLEGYDALKDSVFVGAIRGKVADVPAYVAYRPPLKQLVVAFSGTASFSQALQDLRASKMRYPRNPNLKDNHRPLQCSTHTGFWRLYEGIGPAILKIVEDAFERSEITEVVLTGHSMGGVLCHLLALDMLLAGAGTSFQLPTSTTLKIVSFGMPRWGNADMVRCWNDLMRAYRAEHGDDSIQEFSVKGLNDGVPALPPTYLGYRHVCQTPLYFTQGCLYQIPASECEHAFFRVKLDSPNSYDSVLNASASMPVTSPSSISPSRTTSHRNRPLHPKGGHNYYSERDMEKMQRRMKWLHGVMAKEKESDWREHYLKYIAAHETSRINGTE